MARDHQRQLRAGRADGRGHEHARAAAAHVLGEREQAGLRRAARREDQQRVAFLDERHRAVLDLGAGERLGLDAAHFLELQRRLHRDREAGAAADHEQLVGIDERVDERLPVGVGGALEHFGKRLERGQQRRVVLPVRDDARAGHELRDVALGRGDAGLGAGVQRQHPLRGLGQR